MKYLLLFLFPLSMGAQSFQELVLEYEKDCAEIVLDTINQTGYVFPSSENGPDTVWNKCDCPTYKVDETYYGFQIVSDSSMGFYYSPPINEKKKPYREVERIKICRVQKRKVKPFSDHFWSWIKSQ